MRFRKTFIGWADRLFYASDYFQQLHDYAVELIKSGKDGPYRDPSIEESLDLFACMIKRPNYI